MYYINKINLYYYRAPLTNTPSDHRPYFVII